VAGFNGRREARSLSAKALDRFLQRIGRPQVLGTQAQRTENDPWTQEPYDRSLPDTVRQEYGVPPLAEQARQLADQNRQKP
jgi:hypothetical protein